MILNMTDTEIPVPENLPSPGFYHHYKHSPQGPEHEAAYEVLGTGWHTETGEFCVIYRPLYEGWAYAHKLTYLRPASMFMDTVQKAEYHGPRFIPITDPELIARLDIRRDQMYSGK
jgi:hypothetical protein